MVIPVSFAIVIVDVDVLNVPIALRALLPNPLDQTPSADATQRSQTLSSEYHRKFANVVLKMLSNV